MSFAKDYTAAQHSLEVTEAGGMLAFEIVVILVTMGAGAIASVRHIGKLKALKSLIEDLVKLLKQRAFKKNKSGETNTTLESKNELKEGEDSKFTTGEKNFSRFNLAPKKFDYFFGKIAPPPISLKPQILKNIKN